MYLVFEFCVAKTILSITLLNYFKSIGTVFDLPKSKSSLFVFKLFKLVGILTNLLMSSLSTSDFKAIKSLLAAKLDVSTLIVSLSFFW